MTDFLPVLLGSDANVYGMARSFYQQYGVTSAAICKARLVATANSKLVRIAVVEPSLEDDAVFEKTLIEFAKTNPGKPLVLVSCADGYTILLGRHREALRPYYHFACPPVETVLSLDIKDNFSKACEAHGLSYPKTATCTAVLLSSSQPVRIFTLTGRSPAFFTTASTICPQSAGFSISLLPAPLFTILGAGQPILIS